MQACVGQARELDSTIQVRGMDRVVDGKGGGECHTLILLDTPSNRKDPNEPLNVLPKEIRRI